MPLSSALLRKLDDALVGRCVREGFTLLDRASEEVAKLTPQDPLAVSYLLNIAQWVDLGYRDLHLVEELLERFSAVVRANMKTSDYLQLRMTEAFLVFASEDATTAISILQGVLALEPGITEPRFILMAHFWKARSHRQKGEYQLALHHVHEAESLAQQLRAPKLIAVIQIHESWLLFQSGQRKEAFRLLDEAESELKITGHDLSLGNIESARGRFVRRSGEYAKALQHFQRAIAIYSKHFPNHPNLARALVNAAYVKRLIAFDLSHSADEGRARGIQHDRYLKICRDALELLERAREIYALHQHQVGTGSVLVNAGHLHLDSGDIDRASAEAVKAFYLGEEKQDHILMARARILQAAIENTRVEEQVGEAEDIASHANLATQYSEEAIALAKQTQNQRLLAGAYVVRGATAANDFFEEWDMAKQFASLATDLLSPDDRDHLSKELLVLKSRILRAIGIDQTLRSWSDGLTGDKSFQQITEEFAEIVIPKVWMREDRKISKVAAKLSISPKKVRRILRNAQLLY
jgi:tetratricopeptide (TPR) repeat protein